MRYYLNGKGINISESTIKSYIKNFNMTKDKAIQLYLEENGYIENEELEALEKKAEQSGVVTTIHEAKKTTEKKKRVVTRKENPVKKQVIQALFETIQKIGGKEAEILNPEKIIQFFMDDGNRYEIDLKKKNKPK